MKILIQSQVPTKVNQLKSYEAVATLIVPADQNKLIALFPFSITWFYKLRTANSHKTSPIRTLNEFLFVMKLNMAGIMK